MKATTTIGSKLNSLVPSLSGWFGLVCSVALFAACSGSEGVEPATAPGEQQTAISFIGGQQEEQAVTRAATPLEDIGITSFRVWGYKEMSPAETQTVMPGYIVRWTTNTAATSTTNSDGWEYLLPPYPDQTIKYWDFGAQAYRFFAVTGGVTAEALPADDEVKTAFRFTFPANAAQSEDAPLYTHLWRNGKSSDLYGKPVRLAFLRPFARVRFMFIYSNPEPGPSDPPLPMVEEPDFRPNPDIVTDPGTGTEEVIARGIATKGTFSVTFPFTAGGATEESWETTDLEEALVAFTVPYTEATPQWYMVMPCKEQNAYILRVTINGEEKTCDVPQEYMSWLPGYQYTYIFKVSESGGVELDMVRVGVTDWLPGKEGDHILYNW